VSFGKDLEFVVLHCDPCFDLLEKRGWMHPRLRKLWSLKMIGCFLIISLSVLLFRWNQERWHKILPFSQRTSLVSVRQPMDSISQKIGHCGFASRIACAEWDAVWEVGKTYNRKRNWHQHKQRAVCLIKENPISGLLCSSSRMSHTNRDLDMNDGNKSW
jgi:hypothetical protein